MKKNCINCGKEFEAKQERQCYCSAKCSTHYRHGYKRTHEDVERDKSEAIKLFHAGASLKEIASRMNKSYSWTHKVVVDSGLGKQLTPLQKQVKELRLRGMCSVEIAEALNKECKTIVSVANKILMPFTEEEKEKSIQYGKEKSHNSIEERIEISRKFIEENFSQFEYVTGFINSDDFMTLKCRECGSLIEKSAITIRKKNGKTICPVCAKNDRLLKQKENEAERKRQQEKREEERKFEIFKREFQQESFKRCECCGSLFLGRNRKYCSSECAKKILNNTHKDKRIKKMRAVIIDKDISLEKLYQRDSGRCWICGEQCDYNDYKTTKEGHFIVGGAYPSIDHVKPLSKGGLHSWENIKLAHHYCNTIKNDKVV